MSLKGNEIVRTFLDKLTATTNVSNYVELPMIAVMGETSSGKSSLLSSVSGVELPSASELTTRCPIMLQMNRSTACKANVNVQWKDIPEGKSRKDIEFQTVIVTEDKWSELPGAVARAQSHIIAISGKNVAKDIVHVKVEGPHCEDLTVVDLPGIVRTRGVNEDASIIEDIKALIDDYLSNSRCVILAVIPANVDFHNSQIMADALKVDPETRRTIPVITKPDLIDAGAEADVQDLLLGRKTQNFSMGFHMVKGRGQTDLNQSVTIDEGLAKEEAFFRNAQPWRSVTKRALFGTENLRKKLGKLQLDLIQETLPAIISEIKEKHERASSELRGMGDIPKTLTEKRMFYREISEELVATISSLLQGKSKGPHTRAKRAKVETLTSKLHCKCNDFQSALRASRFAHISTIKVGTNVLVSIKKDIVLGTVVGEKEGSFYVDYFDRVTHNRVEFIRLGSVQSDPKKSKESKGSTWTSNDGSFCIADGDGYHDILRAILASNVRRDPSWILPWINQNRTDDLPIFVNTLVFQAIVISFIDDEWVLPSQSLVKDSHNILMTAAEEAIESLKKLFQYPKLKNLLLRQLKAVSDLLVKKAEARVEHFIEKERSPYTQDHYLFENLSKMRIAPVIEHLKQALDLTSNPSSSLKKDSIESIIDAIANTNRRKSVEEHMAEDMQMALDAYVKVVLKRFIDCIPMECWKIFKEYPVEVKSKLNDASDQKIDHCLVVDNDFERRREELEAEVNELQAGLDVLESLF